MDTAQPQNNSSQATTEPVVSPPDAISATSEPIKPAPRSAPKKLILGLVVVFVLLVLTAGGYYLMSNNLLTTNNSQLTTISPTVQPTIDPTAEWKTYTDSSEGFSLKYPSDWHTNECRGAQFDIEPFNDCGSSRRYLIEVGSSPDTEEQIIARDKEFRKEVIVENIEINGKSYTQIQGSGAKSGIGPGYIEKSTTTLFPYKNKTFFVIYNYGIRDTDYMEVYQNLLRTFTYPEESNSVDTSTWKTYVSNKFSYSINYPPDGIVKPNTNLEDYSGWLENILFEIPINNNGKVETYQFQLSIWDNLNHNIVTLADFQTYCRNLKDGFREKIIGPGCEPLTPYETKNIQGQKAYYTSGGISSSKHEVYYVPYKDYVYELDRTTVPAWADPLNNPSILVSEAILASFKFTK